jgi:hypothetical protein
MAKSFAVNATLDPEAEFPPPTLSIEAGDWFNAPHQSGSVLTYVQKRLQQE